MAWVKCDRVEPHEPHEHTIIAPGTNIVVAGGRCEGEGRNLVDEMSLAKRLELLARAFDESVYSGGVHGTCYECPFASPPLRADGSEARWEEVSNDPTEAYFRCSLPTRRDREKKVEWGEYAPCTDREWVLALTFPERDKES